MNTAINYEVTDTPLLAEHIKVGTLLWYNGFTSGGSWDCPAVITTTRIDTKNKHFKVRSLDDMIEQNQWYEFTASEHSREHSRNTMRLASKEEVRNYLELQQKKLEESVTDAKNDLADTESRLDHFKQILETISL